MNFLRNLLFVLILSVTAVPAWAERQQLASVRTDSEGSEQDVSIISAVTDASGNLTGLHLLEPSKETTFALAALRAGYVPLVQKDDPVDVDVILATGRLHPQNGGTIHLAVMREFHFFGSNDYRRYDLQISSEVNPVTNVRTWRMSRVVLETGVNTVINDLFFHVAFNRGARSLGSTYRRMKAVMRREVGIGRITASFEETVVEWVNTANLSQLSM